MAFWGRAAAVAFSVASGLLRCRPSATESLKGHVPIGPPA
jgi:hypothetical protein